MPERSAVYSNCSTGDIATIQYLYVRIKLMKLLVLMMIGKDMVRIWNEILDTILYSNSDENTFILKVRNLLFST